MPAAKPKHALPDAGPDISGPALESEVEIIMSTVLRSAVVAVALFASASAAMAAPRDYRSHQTYHNNGSDAGLTFWEAQQRNGS